MKYSEFYSYRLRQMTVFLGMSLACRRGRSAHFFMHMNFGMKTVFYVYQNKCMAHHLAQQFKPKQHIIQFFKKRKGLTMEVNSPKH